MNPGNANEPVRRWVSLTRFGLVPLVVLFYGIAALHFDYTPDDTYIYLQYARNLVEGNGFAFNPGEPSSGVTGPLWALLIAAGAAGGLDPYVVAKTLDLFFASASILLVYLLAFGILRDYLYAFAAVCLVAVDSWLLRWAGSGMETSLAVMLVLLALFHVYRQEYALASLVCGFLTLVRPEGGMLFVFIQMDHGFLVHDRVRFRRMLVRSVVLYVAVVVPWLLFAWGTFGSIIPNTFGAKSISPYSIASTWFVLGSEVKILASTQGTAMVLVLLGLVLARRQRLWMATRLEIFPLFWVVAVLVFYIASNVQVVSRYLLIVSPLIAIYGIWGVKKMQEMWKLNWPRTLLVLAAAVLLTVGENVVVYGGYVLPHMSAFTRGMNECLRPMGYWLSEQSQPESTVLTPDIGILGYTSRRTLFDTAGLLSPAVKRAWSGISYDDGMKERRYEAVVQPDFIVDRSEEPERLTAPDLVPIMTKEFSSIAISKDHPVYYTLYKSLK